ncbi:hypothetical protein GS18_0210745 [Metabacillus indicus]|uniref:ParB/Sulfiredoxin domain-containing protein n=2 Tax=Metabacillus indicus TaxID=246786 RepID=A0A084GW89_METID|nr:hypothetical protein GS18_0210745 [Metabacillus indicus]
MESKIQLHEIQSRIFQPARHFHLCMEEMKIASQYGTDIAEKWLDVYTRILAEEEYPVVHPIGQETFSLYAEYEAGVFEYALDIDGATAYINKNGLKAEIFEPSRIIHAVDQGNVNTDPARIKPNHKNPVMILQNSLLTNGKPYCINGNHRLTEAYKSGFQHIEVYVFREMEAVPLFYDTLSKAAYFLEIDRRQITGDLPAGLNGKSPMVNYFLG